MRRSTVTLSSLLLLLGAAACSDDTASPDAGPVDSGPDVPAADAGPDAGDGAVPDSGPLDTGPSDTGVSDTGTADAGMRFEHCPPQSDYVGDPGWPIGFEVTPTATFCTRFSEARSLVEELAAKAMLRFVPGSYGLPTEDGSHEYLLPACVAYRDGPGPMQTTAGTLDHSESTFGDETYHQNHFRMPLTEGIIDGNFAPLQIGSTLPMFVLDGGEGGPERGADWSLALCPDNTCSGAMLLFDSCTHESSPPQLHHVMLADDAEVHFELRIGGSFAGTEPGAFVRAYGRFGGVDFDQRDYWNLVYNPTHHHFERHFAVLFDEPIDGVCGLEVVGLEAFDDFTPDEAYAVDCELTRIREVVVNSASLERP